MRSLWRYCRHRPDLVLAALLTGGAAIALALTGQLDDFPASACVLGFCGLIALRGWRPLPVAVAAGVLIATANLAAHNSTILANATFTSVGAAIFLYSYVLGSDARFPLSLLGIAVILVGVNLSEGGWNPLPEMLALGPYAGGLAVASRRRASAELEQRARELEEEREIFTTESVRYERARIARELHDIVAHSVSLMVVQASAGERLAALDPESAAEAFSAIGEAAQQAEAEIDRLVELLNDTSQSPAATGPRIVEELVARAQASGVAISCQLRGDIDDLTDGGADAAYRMVQEGITNAMKHAPGASMEVTIRGSGDWVEVRVVNGPARSGPSGLERAGGGHGLAGMRERVIQHGGTFVAGPTQAGGWQLVARFPRRAADWTQTRPKGV
ncbi:MAG: histidine kinase [Acidimicrobiales bacterium]